MTGLDATYLAASLRQPKAPPEAEKPAIPPPSSPRPTTDRLEELSRLREAQLITQTEYDERRKAIIDGV